MLLLAAVAVEVYKYLRGAGTWPSVSRLPRHLLERVALSLTLKIGKESYMQSKSRALATAPIYTSNYIIWAECNGDANILQGRHYSVLESKQVLSLWAHGTVRRRTP